MACPPEDIGGVGGYQALKNAIDGQDDDWGQEILEALDGDFSPYAMDLQSIKFMLEPIQRRYRRR